jgi:predicted GNAT family N-acyltransferase
MQDLPSDKQPAWDFSVRQADWCADRQALRAVREAVFIREQSVPADMEWDDADETCVHALACAGSHAIGTGRLLPDGHIGRMAVLKAWRGRGVGSAILEYLIATARERGLRRVALNAQVQAVPFYERFGFKREGEVFPDAGIPHLHMRREL